MSLGQLYCYNYFYYYTITFAALTSLQSIVVARHSVVTDGTQVLQVAMVYHHTIQSTTLQLI